MTQATAAVLTVQLLMAFILASAAWGKLARIEMFASILSQYSLLPERLTASAARLVPAIELAVAVGLIIPSTREVEVFLAVGLLLAFSAAIAANLLRGRASIRCGCSFSSGAGDQLRWWMVVRNLLLAGALAASLGVSEYAVQWNEAAAICAAALTFAILYHALPELLLSPPSRRSRA
jgi:hypothetical protein